MAQDIWQAFRTEIASITGLSGKVSPLDVDQDVALPYVRYASRVERELDLNGPVDLVKCLIDVQVYHSSYANLKTLTGLVANKIKSFNCRVLGSSGPYCEQAEIESQEEEYNNEVSSFIGILEVNIYYKEA